MEATSDELVGLVDALERLSTISPTSSYHTAPLPPDTPPVEPTSPTPYFPSARTFYRIPVRVYQEPEGLVLRLVASSIRVFYEPGSDRIREVHVRNNLRRHQSGENPDLIALILRPEDPTENPPNQETLPIAQ